MFLKSKHYFIAILIMASMPIFTSLSAQEDEGLEAQLHGLLPKPGELSDWRIASEPRFFNPDNLFEYIDGAADLYLLYGFRKVITADYAVGADSSSATVEIYCLASPTHAFGIYAAERSPKEQPIAIGVQGYLGANVLNFYKGPYYIKITSFALSKNLSNSLEQMGRSIADKIPGELAEPEIFRFFPEENKVKQSERYIPTSFLGQSYLENGYRCDYASDDETYQAFLVPLKSDTAAIDVLKKYQRFLESQDYKVSRQGDENTIIAEKGQFILAFAFRSYFGGVLNIKSLKQGQKVVQAMVSMLPNH
ncbi:MAG: hypothetical protein ONB16_10145 [candidate division KSB1 bacterium]|nr:hypothetical protein [candidate division KSB1 bacterium]